MILRAVSFCKSSSFQSSFSISFQEDVKDMSWGSFAEIPRSLSQAGPRGVDCNILLPFSVTVMMTLTFG